MANLMVGRYKLTKR